MRFNFRDSAAAAVALVLVATGCQSGAPPLPADTTAVNSTRTLTSADFTADDAALRCDQIQAERRRVSEAMQAANQRVAADRAQNQAAGYFLGVLYFAPYAASQGSTHPQKEELGRLYARQDTLIKLATFRRCTAN
ncbi:MAG: hypothetical protein HY060_02875 [Proteobacteria bacterium]|nr:hypothetical protein [Pseudomonadota bacterium]